MRIFSEGRELFVIYLRVPLVVRITSCCDMCSSGPQGMWKEVAMSWRDWGTRQWTSLRIVVSEPIFEPRTLGTGKRIVTQSKAKAFSQARCFHAPYQFTSFLNLWPLTFSLTPFDPLVCRYLSLFMLWGYRFWFTSFFDLRRLFQEHD